MLFKNLYNNHRASNPYLFSIHNNLYINIDEPYSIVIPLWTLCFFSGLFRATLGYAMLENKGKVKGRQVNDPSALLLGTNDYVSLNSHIDKRDPVAMPPMQYQYTLQILCRRV